MKGCTGTTDRDYFQDREGNWTALKPFLHCPDLCPYYRAQFLEGDCRVKCTGTHQRNRPCLVARAEATAGVA